MTELYDRLPGQRHDSHFHATSLGFDLDGLDGNRACPDAVERRDLALKLGLERGEFGLRLLQALLRVATSWVSFADRPTPRAAVVARPSVESDTARRPISAPSIVAPNETAVCSFCCDACCCSLPTASSALCAFSRSRASFGA